MKRILPYIALAAGAVLAVSCQKDLDTYEGQNGMYFDMKYAGAETFTDTLDVSWGMKNATVTEQQLDLTVRLFGHTAPYDRAFEIVIEDAPTYVSLYKPETSDPEEGGEGEGEGGENPGEGEGGEGGDTPLPEEPENTVVPTEPAEEGTDYMIPARTYVIPAGQAEVTIPVTLYRRHDLHLAKRSFKVRLIENNELKFLFSRALPEYLEDGTLTTRPFDYQRIIRMDESFPIPNWWPVRGEPYFGDFSQKKAMLICDMYNLDREQWMADQIPAGKLRFVGQEMQKYLNEMKAKGETVYEDEKDANGNLVEMVMGAQSQL